MLYSFTFKRIGSFQLLNYLSRIMPSHCCVYNCTKKGYRDEEGNKISYFKFPLEKTLKNKWIHAIRREEGPNFQITDSTKVCSRHFRAIDIKKTLAGKNLLKTDAVPSVFPWTRTSPRKRKPPTERHIQNAKTLRSEEEDSIESVVEEADDFEVIAGEVLPKVFVEIATQTDCDAIELEAILTEVTTQCERIRHLELEIKDLNSKIRGLEENRDNLDKKVFKLNKFMSNNCAANFYTGFENWDAFMCIYRYLNPGQKAENIRFWNSSSTNLSSNDTNQDKGGRPRTLNPLDEFFLVMCRLRQGFHEEHLAHLFDISVSTVSRIFISWINFMFLKLGSLNIWPSRETINRTMPEDFKIKYASTRVIIDCTEIKCQMPSSLQLNGELFSSYKHHTTLKGLIGISPGGPITFISQLYTGSISDREIVTRSGFLDLPFNEGDSVMADKGFTIEDILPLDVSLNLPPFLGSVSQMPSEDVVRTQEIASLRIHVERAINKVKNFHFFDRVVPLHQFGLVNQIWTVCALLCNSQPNIISVIENATN